MLKFNVVLSAIALITVVSGCVVVPKRVAYYDEPCNITHYRYTLSYEEYLDSFYPAPCEGKTCAGQLAIMAVGGMVVLPVSAVVSGAVSVVGNGVAAVEKRQLCEDQAEGSESV